MTGLDPEVAIKCPKCRKTLKKKLSWLKAHNTFVCTCGETIRIEPSALKTTVKGFSEVNKILTKFGK